MKNWKRILAMILAICSLLGLAGCAGSEPESEAAPVPEAEAPSPGEAEVPEEPGPAEAPETPAPEETAPEVFPEEEEAEVLGETTLMIYMIGSDLEAKQRAASRDMEEMIGSGVDLERTRVLVCTGGSARWWNGLGDPRSLTLLRLTEEGFVPEETLPLQSMGEPDCLAAFVNLCVQRYPADHYAMIFWDHGNGPVMGYGKDFLFEGDSLTLEEMRLAMEQTPFAGELRLDWVGFDACLMASAELACVWKDYADYLVSSQETEPGFGWDYSFLKRCGSAGPRTLTRSIADCYLSFAEAEFASREDYFSEVTMSVLDLSRTGELEDAVNALFRAAAADVSGDYLRLAQARVDTRAMGRSSTGSEYDLVDLLTIAERMEADYPKESAALQAVLGDMVVYSVSNTPQCSGMSLYYPYYNKQYYRKTWKETYRELAVFPEYLKFLERYEQIWLGTDLQRYFSEGLELEEGAEPSTYTLQLSPEQAEVYAKSNYYILGRLGEGLYSLIYCSDDVTMEEGKLTAVFDGQVLYYETDFGEKGIPFSRMWDTVDGVTDYSVMNVMLSRGEDFGDGDDSMWAEVRYSKNQKSGEIQIKGIFSTEEDEDEFSGGKEEAVELSDWDLIRFYYFKPRYLIRDENGRIPYFWDWPESGWITWHEVPVMDHPHFSYEPLYDDGYEYFILFNVMDLQGNTYSSELFPIQLAPAPEKAEEPADLVLWEGEDQVVLLEKDGVTVSLTASLAFDSGEPVYYLVAENRSDYPVIVQIEGKDAVVNGEIQCDDTNLVWMSLDPGASRCDPIEELTRNVKLSREGRLCSLVCPCELFRRDNEATLYKGRLEVRVSEQPELSVRWDSLLDARAERQAILAADGVGISLLQLGAPVNTRYYGDIDTLTIPLRVFNHSGSPREIQFCGLQINGVSFGLAHRILLQDGQLWYPMIDLRETIIQSLGYNLPYDVEADEEAFPTIGSISSCTLFLSINGKLYSCPFRLTEQGEEMPLVPEGKLFYQDEEVELWLHKFEHASSDGKDVPIWYFWVVNRGGHMLNLYCMSSKPYPSSVTSNWGALCPGGIRFCSVADQSGNGDALSIVLSCYSIGYESEPIVLPRH